MGKSEDEISKFIDEELEEEDKLIEEEIFMNERVFAEEKKTLDLRKKRCTDMKGNRRTVFPGSRPVKEEAVQRLCQRGM